MSTPDPTAPQQRPPPPPVSLTRVGAPTVTELWAPPKTNLMAVASLVLSPFWLGGLGSVGAVVLGHMAKREIARSEGRQAEANLAQAGLVVGYVGLAIMLLYLLVYAAALSHA